MTEYVGQGEAKRTLELLWGKAAPARRGPNQRTSVDEIVATALAIADRDGLAGVTMRAVGRDLDRTAMSLYTYVPGREELITLMYDRAHAELKTSSTKDWRKAATKWSVELRDLYVRHPWLLEVSQARPAFGPHEQDVLESLLRILARAELAIEHRPSVTSALYGIVREAAKQKLMGVVSEQDRAWWAERAKVLQEVAPDFADRFPESTAIAQHQAKTGPDPWRQAAEEAFSGAVSLVLDGVGLRSK